MPLIDLIFPKYCVKCRKMGAYVCASCFVYIAFNEGSMCVVCQRQSIDGVTHPYCRTRSTIEGVFSSLVYAGIVKKLIYQFKYKPHVKDLTSFLIELFYEGLIQKEMFHHLSTEKSVLVPIPLYAKRLKTRGYNQSQLLAEGLAKKCTTNVLLCLERIRDTNTQFKLSKTEREENIKGAFAVKKEFLDKLPKQVLLVDDIVTSGATLAEAAKVLKKAGVEKVWGLTLAHGQ